MERFIQIKERSYYLITFIFGIVLLFLAIPKGINPGQARIMPTVYAIVLTVVALYMVIRSIIRKGEGDALYKISTNGLGAVLIAILIYMGYSLTIQVFGFFTMSAIFLIVFSVYLKESFKMAILITLVLLLSIYYLFTKTLSLYFPSGMFL